MTIENTTVEAIPTWAVCYIVNGDTDNLSDEEIATIRDFQASLYADGISLTCPVEDGSEYFSAHPAFGKASTVVDFDALVRR